MHQIIAKSKGWELILQGTVLNPVQSHAKCSFLFFLFLHLQQMLDSSTRLHHKANYFSKKRPKRADGNSSWFQVHSIYKTRLCTGFEIRGTGWLCIMLTDLHTHIVSSSQTHTNTPKIGHVECWCWRLSQGAPFCPFDRWPTPDESQWVHVWRAQSNSLPPFPQ